MKHALVDQAKIAGEIPLVGMLHLHIQLTVQYPKKLIIVAPVHSFRIGVWKRNLRCHARRNQKIQMPGLGMLCQEQNNLFRDGSKAFSVKLAGADKRIIFCSVFRSL